MLRAEQEGIAPAELIKRVSADHRRDFAAYRISVDNYITTHDPENEEMTAELYRRLAARGLIGRKVVKQAYDEERQMFLPDRYVRGTCPNCGTPDQYGDSCENCGRDLFAARSQGRRLDAVGHEAVGARVRAFVLEAQQLRKRAQRVGAEARRRRARTQARRVVQGGLKDWDISRDPPYFGFAIPGEKNKFFYVWFDAPIGYMASFLNLCRRTPGLDFGEFWDAGSRHELYHFIGKDIPYFHALFWPAMLSGAGYRKPSALFVHGHVTVDGEKMSKRRGTFIPAGIFAKHLDPDYLRYYYASKLGARIEDIDLNFADLVAKVNSDLVGKLVNIASRCAGFIEKLGGGTLAERLPDDALYAEFSSAAAGVAADYEQREYSRAVRRIMALADRANQYIDEKKPWLLAKNGQAAAEVVGVCTLGLNLFRALMIYLKPVLPALTERAEKLLAAGELRWSDVTAPLLGRKIARFEPLLQRIELATLEKIVAETRATIEGTTTAMPEMKRFSPPRKRLPAHRRATPRNPPTAARPRSTSHSSRRRTCGSHACSTQASSRGPTSC